jgi:conjugal transfer mating pair stabilization protein TraG
MIIYTYGGGDILYNIFQGVAKLHNGGVLKQLFAIGGMMGLTMAVIKAFFSNQTVVDLVKTWFLPLVIGYGLFFMPKSQVLIKDIITQSEKSVASVPYGLALVSKLSSGLGYQITQAIESALRIPDKLSYNNTGHIFGAEHMMEIANFTWTDPTAEQNMRNFVVNCITYDVMLGRYSIDNLKNKVDLWPFIRDRTSVNRGVYWIQKDDDRSPTLTYCSCREAATKLDQNIQTEVAVKKKIFQHMPIAFQALTGISESAETILRQQLMLHSFVEGVETKASSLGLGHDFAVQRAYLQQQSTMMIAGGLAGKSVAITRVIFEALILVSFIFVVPMLAFPMGIRTFARWAEMVAWINLWPPVYAVLNFILQSAAKSRSEQILKFQETWTGLGGAGKGLSLATATPLANLYTDMVAYAGWASLFVPVLAYMILKGGMSSFVHIAGNMMQASQGAAGAAAQEQVTGNYSYGNVSMGNTQYNTAQMNQHGLSARFSDGYMQESTGHYDMTYTPEGSVMDQKVSHLPVNFSVGQSLSNGYQRRAESALNSAYSEGAQMNQTWDQAYREMASFDQHMGQHSGMNSGQSMGIDTSTQQSMQTAMSQAQTFAKKYGVEESRAMSYLAGLSGTASIGGNLGPVALSASANLGANYSGSASKQQMIEDAISIATSKDFTESMSQLKRFSQNTDFSDGQDIGKRLSETLSTTFDRSDHLSKSIGQHLSASENYSKSASYARDNSARMDQNYNDEMWQGFVRHVGGNASEAASIYNSKEGWAREIVDDFNAKYFQRMEHQLMKQSEPGLASDSGFRAATSTMAKHHDVVVDKMKAPSHATFESERDSLKEMSGVRDVNQDIQTQKETFKSEKNDIQQNLKTSLKNQKESLEAQRRNLKEEYKESDNEWIGKKAGRATFIPSALSKPKMSDTDKKKD